MKKMLLILNPNAGLRQARRLLPEMIARFTDAGYLCTVMITEKRGDAVGFAADLAGDFDTVVTCGGDGTLNETITGLMRGGHTTLLGYIPCGSTNDFAASLGYGKDLMQNCDVIAEGTARTLDIGCYNGERYFSYTASFGAFTSASYTTPQDVKNVLGHAAYILEGIRSLPEIRPVHMRFTVDGEEHEDDWLFGAVCNSTSLGGVLKLDAADVDMNDGMFEMLMVRNPKDILELNRILSSLAAKKHDDPLLCFYRGKEFRFMGDPEMKWTLDGEAADGGEEITVRNIPGAIRLICPAGSAGGGAAHEP